MIISADPAPAMLAELRMTSLEGPVVRGGTRGVRFIEVGFIQNAKFSKQHADYDRFATPRTRFSNVEGKTVWLDTVAPLTPSVSPWYNSTNVNIRSLYYHGIDPVSGAVADIDLAMADTPKQYATDTMPLTIVENGVQVTKTPSRFEIVMDFNTYLAVRTKELNELAAEEVYT